MRIKKATVFASLILLTAVWGCDKIPFLSNFSNSQKNTSPSSSPTIASSVNEPLPADAVAKVGNWILTKEDFEERLKNLKEVAPDFDTQDLESRRLVLEELVRQQLLVLDAQQSGLANKEDIREAVTEFERTLLVRAAAEEIVSGITAGEEEARQYYDQNKNLFVDAAEWRVREIVTFSEAAAKEILIELLKGNDFAEMAKSRSKSKSAASGGDLGFLTEPPFPQMATALSPLEVGGVSGVFKGPEGYYIVKLEEKKGGEQKSFADVKEDIINGLTAMKQQQAILDRINTLRQKTAVKINEDLLKE